MKQTIRAFSVRTLVGFATLTATSTASAGTWGLLANTGLENQPVKGIYFFPGDPKTHVFFTLESNLPTRDYNWNDTSPLGFSVRQMVVSEMAGTGANVIFAQYSGLYSDIHFVNNTIDSFLNVFYASKIVNGPYIVPALEKSFQCNGSCPPDTPPTFSPDNDIAPKSTVGVDYLNFLITKLYVNGLLDKWAKVYDRFGQPRYAIQIAEAAAKKLKSGDDDGYTSALDEIADELERDNGITIGFLLTPVELNVPYYSILSDHPYRMANLSGCKSCLGIVPYFSELPGVTTFCQHKMSSNFRGFVDCNIGGDIDAIARQKKDRAKLWANSGVPFYVDVDAGYDAHLVFNPMAGAASGRAVGSLFGETGYTFDHWRNMQSELKGHQGDGNLAPSGIGVAPARANRSLLSYAA